MGYLIAAVGFSVAVSVLLKLFPRHGIDTGQAVTWNYLAASLLCAWLFAPPLASLRGEGAPWLGLLGLAFILPTLFMVLAVAVQRAGIVRTDVAQRLSLLLSLAAAFVIFGERTSTPKVVGLLLGLVAVVAILARPRDDGPRQRGALWALLLVWVGYAVVDVMLKLIAQAGTPFAASLQVAFVTAFLGMLAVQALRQARGQTRLSLRGLIAGLLLGGLNFGNIVCYVQAHRSLPDSPAVVFASMNIGVVVLGTLTGVVAFGEPTSRLNRLGIALAILAIALIAFART
jgi:drug/metabolite transporter (DMT)-like permease